uniref:Putative Rho guanine nucleotide exchange factor FGD-1 n=1 Tax=Caenorhabditis elegans TaxID=6239 RepID=G5ED03_CAEEL|nr:putative Rho guanine nucleotide exchange factor FGD-1 [Caenorhabditis elegans]
MSSLVQLPSQPSSAFQLDFDAVRNFQNVPPVDLEGGTLIDATEEEEIDPVDGCTVRVFTYRILSADEMEELTKTVRQKIKFDCTQTMRSLKMIGSEANVVEKSQRISGDIKGMKPIEFSNNSKQICLDQHSLQLDPNDEQDQQISRVLNQVPNTFMSLLSREKDMFVKLYPELFEKMRTESSLIPSTTTEIITNPDGSTTTRVKSSKSYSSHFSRQETYVNGVKKMSKSKFRAFVEYKGPDGGFQVKLSDGDEFELSEDEQEDDDTSLSQSCYSEIDSESDITGPSPKTDLDKRYQKAWYAAKELVDSEQRYVDKLKLLGDTFRNRLIKEELITNDKITRLLANVSSLYQFHNTHFLPQLLESIRDWHTTKRIANVVRKQAPFLKMYSEYTNNYDRATKLFEELKKKKKFADVVKEIEKQAECEGLPLGHHLICPVQRVMRYQLLLQEYKKHLQPSDVDFDDTTVALELVLQAAAHANEMMKKLDRFGKVIEVQEQLGNSISLVSPGRELLKSGSVQKISSTTEKTEERFIFLFNDLVILASERKMIGVSKYKLRAVFSASHMQVCEGDNLEREHSFYLRGSDGTGPKRCVELFTPTQKEKNDWVDSIFSIIDEAKAHSLTFTSSSRSSISENNNNSIESKHCADCDIEFGFLSRGSKCVKCSRRLCKKCFGRRRNESKKHRICDTCTKNMDLDGIPRSFSTQSNMRRNLLQLPAKGSGVLHSSQIRHLRQKPELQQIFHNCYYLFRGSLGKLLDRFMVVRDDFCMYTYSSEEDICALAMLPLPGCEVKMCGEKFTFSVRVGARRMYTMTAEDEQTQMKWLAILDLAANAHLKNQRNSGSEQSE